MVASTEQFLNKNIFIKTVSVTFYSAQEGIPFIIVHGIVENVMRSQFNIKSATAYWI